MLGAALMLTTDLPVGSAPAPVALPHFPDRLHAFVFRNWPLVPTARMAQAVGAKPADILRMGKAMGLPDPPRITADQQRRSYLTVIRRNWHLLPYEQLLQLLDWDEERLAYTLREDDFLYAKLGSLKPRCDLLKYTPPDERTLAREEEIARSVRDATSGLPAVQPDPLFGFVRRLSSPTPRHSRESGNQRPTPNAIFSPRFCYSYFALYGDPLLDKQADPYPPGYLARMAAAGADGVWLQGVLYKLAPFPWDPKRSEGWEERLRNLRALTARAKKYGIGIYLYLNEPRAMPLSFYAAHAELKGVTEGDYATLCTSDPVVQTYIRDSAARICREVPDLAGFFTITASENLTNCWSHGSGANCPRCGKRKPAEVIAEVNRLIQEGIRQSGSKSRLIIWDWGWADEWTPEIIARLPQEAALMSVSEWSIPIRRGGVESVVSEYSLSAIGPGPRATRHWELARKHGMKTLAKIQAANSWELSAVPYIPVLDNVAQHIANLRRAGVDGLMLGWTLGGYPSPNLEVVAEMGRGDGGNGETGKWGNGRPTPDEAMEAVAERRYGQRLAPAVMNAWKDCSEAFREFPFHVGVVYQAPLQLGPANLLWGEPTGYQATMVGFPYDDLDGWRAVYPPDVFIGQMEKVADGFDRAIERLKRSTSTFDPQPSTLNQELDVSEAAAIHFRSVANQARFVNARNALAAAKTSAEAKPLLAELERVLKSEIQCAKRLYEIQIRDSRLGFESSNHYFYVPVDLLEKIVNCRDLLDRWLPAQRARFGL
jgi:hypothetical protein